MGYYVQQLSRPYDCRALVEVYVRTQRRTYAHEDFPNYYRGLLTALEKEFGLQMSDAGLDFSQRVLWMLFQSTTGSLLQIGTPWDRYLEASLLHKKLEESGEPGRKVMAATDRIFAASSASKSAHYDMLHALFHAIFGVVDRVVTSEQLVEAGFDDSKEPDFSNYIGDL